MLQFDVALYCIGGNVAHKVRRYKNRGSVGVYLRRWAEHPSDVEGFIPNVKGTSLRGILGGGCSARSCNRTFLVELMRLLPTSRFACGESSLSSPQQAGRY